MKAFIQNFVVYPSRSVRRPLIIVAWIIPLVIFGTGLYESAAFSIWHFFLGISLIIFLWLVSFFSRVMRRSGKRLDERQRELNQRVMEIAYPFIAAPVVIAALLYQSGQMQTAIFEFSLSAAFYLVGFLPASIVAWFEPDPVSGDEPRLAEPT